MAQRQDTINVTWDCKEVDWDEYESHRPPYTKALYELLFQHHEEYGGQNHTALDVGAGGGTVTKVLLEKFRHVIWSDQSAEYIARAQQRFRKEADAGSVTLLQRNFDEFQPEVDFPAEQPVDMITAGTCIHFADAARITTQLGPLLRSGGTLAAFSYGGIPILPLNDPAGPIVERCKDKIIRRIDQNIKSLEDAEGPGTCQARYNNVDFDPAMWKHVRRITSLPQEPVWPRWITPAASRVRDTESCETVSDDFIAKEVDYDFFPKHFHNFAPQLPILDWIKEDLEELRVAVADRKITARWPVMVVLGTKK